MEKVIINYSEIGLKGKNKSFFQNRLKGNIVKASAREKLKLISVKKEGPTFIAEFDSDKTEIINCLKNVFGIKHFMFAKEIEKSPEKLFEEFDLICQKFKQENIKFISPNTKRSDKSFPLQSPDINSKLREIAKKYDIEVNYKSEENKIYTRIDLKKIFISFEKYEGFGGLPVGTAGRVLVLLSGGIDSPVAAWSLMRRGCTCDFIHLHNLRSNDEVKDSKIAKTVEELNKFQFKSTLYTLPYETFEFSIMGKVVPRYELVVFKYYLLKLAEKIANEYDYLAIANGDALAQVASQTLENLNVVNTNLNIPIFRPLLTFEKEEIISIAKKINTFDLSILEYKDCCSLVAKNPMTKARPEKFQESIDNVNIDKLIDESFKNLSVFKF